MPTVVDTPIPGAGSAYANAAFWAIDPVNGNDSNLGYGATLAAADSAPLQTMAELNKRLLGASYRSTVVFHQLASIPDAGWTPLTNVSTADGHGYPVWLGKKTTVFSGVATTYAAAVPAGNTGVQMSMAALPVSWTASSLVGKMIESSDGTRVAWVQKDMGAKTARLTPPCTLDVATYTFATVSAFIAGESVNVISVPDLPAYPFGKNIQYAGVQDVNIVSQVNESDTGGASVLFGRAALGNNSMKGAATENGNDIDGCLFNGAAVFLSGAGWVCRCSGSLNSRVAIQRSGQFTVSHTPYDMQASSFVVASGGLFDAFGSDSLLSSFDATAPVIFVSDQAQSGRPVRFNSVTPLYGSGNSDLVLSIPSGTTAVLPLVANCTITTSAARPLSVAGTLKDFASMPYVDLSRLAAVLTDATASAPSSLVFIGFLTASGTISGVPSAARRIQVVATGEAAAGGTLTMKVNAVVAGYQRETPSGSGAYVGPVANWPVYTAGGGVTSFTVWADVTYGPAASGQAYYQGATVDAISGYVSSDGFVASAAAPTSLVFTVASMNQIRISVWAEVET